MPPVMKLASSYQKSRLAEALSRIEISRCVVRPVVVTAYLQSHVGPLTEPWAAA